MNYYTAQEVADILNISIWTVWKYGREGKLKTRHFGRTVRYDLEDADEQRRNHNEDSRG